MTPRRPIEIPVEDGITLRGESRPGERCWAILAHAPGGDLDDWRDVPEQLAALGVGVIAIDLRGHGGSDGEPDGASVCSDLEAAIGAARRHGADVVAVIAANETATVALDRSSADAAVAITPMPAGTEPLPDRPLSRLLVVTNAVASSAAAAALRAQPGRRTLVARIPVDDTGLDLLAGEWASNISSVIVTFMRQVALAATAAPHPTQGWDRTDGR
jgi:pimeloyl-ACP methyl ester carboxylesterase